MLISLANNSNSVPNLTRAQLMERAQQQRDAAADKAGKHPHAWYLDRVTMYKGDDMQAVLKSTAAQEKASSTKYHVNTSLMLVSAGVALGGIAAHLAAPKAVGGLLTTVFIIAGLGGEIYFGETGAEAWWKRQEARQVRDHTIHLANLPAVAPAAAPAQPAPPPAAAIK